VETELSEELEKDEYTASCPKVMDMATHHSSGLGIEKRLERLWFIGGSNRLLRQLMTSGPKV
jgi:hypothetical protein